MSLVSSCSQLIGPSVGTLSQVVKKTGGTFANVLQKSLGAVSNGLDRVADMTGSTKSATDTGNVLQASTTNGKLSLDDLRAAVGADMATLKNKILAMLQQAGIELSPAFDLAADGEGGISVTGDRSDLDAITSLLNSDPTLKQEFTRMTSNAELLEAAIEAQEFQQAYAQDPFAAVQAYRYLFDGSASSSIHLAVDGDAMELQADLKPVATV